MMISQVSFFLNATLNKGVQINSCLHTMFPSLMLQAIYLDVCFSALRGKQRWLTFCYKELTLIGLELLAVRTVSLDVCTIKRLKWLLSQELRTITKFAEEALGSARCKVVACCRYQGSGSTTAQGWSMRPLHALHYSNKDFWIPSPRMIPCSELLMARDFLTSQHDNLAVRHLLGSSFYINAHLIHTGKVEEWQEVRTCPIRLQHHIF